MRDARHLGGDGGDRLAPEMLVVGILGDVAAIARWNEFSRWRIATCAAIQKVRRRRALPNFDSLVWPRNMPDWWVARSNPQNFRNWRWWPKRRRSPASAKMVSAMIGPMPGNWRSRA